MNYLLVDLDLSDLNSLSTYYCHNMLFVYWFSFIYFVATGGVI